MQIFKVNNINFLANTAKIRKNNKQNNAKEAFYNHIQNYMDDKCTKKEYFDNFYNDIKSLTKSNVTADEKKFIYDLLITTDLADNIENISEKYLKNNMQKLLGKKP